MNDQSLTTHAIKANISYYESLIQDSYDVWQQHVNKLQYWLEILESKETESINTL